MLSMIPFPALAAGPSEAYKVAGALSGGQPPLFTYSPKPPAQAIHQVAAEIRVKEIEFTSFAGEPVYLVRETPKKTRIVPVNFDPAPFYDPDIVATVVARAVNPLEVVEARLVDKYEAYYLDRHGDLPLPALFIRLNDPSKSTFYVDLNTARLVAAYSTVSRWNRWLYHGFHSLDFPWLYRYRPAWDVVVMTLLLAGLGLSVTAVVIAWQVLRGKFGRLKHPLHLSGRPSHSAAGQTAGRSHELGPCFDAVINRVCMPIASACARCIRRQAKVKIALASRTPSRRSERRGHGSDCDRSAPTHGR